MPQQNVNPYNQIDFQNNFQKTKTFELLKSKYTVYFDKFFEKFITTSTPRHHHSFAKISAVPWYYLNYLDSSKQIVDLGCGCNFFKPYFPNLHGIGAENIPELFFGDEHDFVDDKFYQGHVDAYDSVFSINSLHFAPLETLQTTCINFCNMLKPGGRGFLALNVQRMLERSETLRGLHNEDLDAWIRNQFNDFPFKILVFDVDLSMPDAWMDGNIRIVFEK